MHAIFPRRTGIALAAAVCGLGLFGEQQANQHVGVEARVESMLRRLTLEQKIDLLGGVDGFYTRAIPEIGLPRLKMSDGPLGARNDGPATAMPGGIALASTWNIGLAREVGLQIGRDARARGVHFMLGPGVNIYRAPMNGRNFEYFGEDPWLASRIAVGYIEGMQSESVSATIKHFMGNNSEYLRHDTDSVIDERTMREIYMPAFEAAVKEAHTGSVMDSYNFLNGEQHESERIPEQYCCQEGVGLRRHHDVRLGVHLRRCGCHERRDGSGDARRRSSEPEDSPAGNSFGKDF
jgi:beta-glucosidase